MSSIAMPHSRAAAIRPRRAGLMHPGHAMMIFWVGLYIVYALAPIRQTPAAGANGTAFNAAFVLLFALSARVASLSLVTATRRRAWHPAFNDQFVDARLLWLLACLGCTGALLSIFDKASAAPVLVLAEAASLRNERAQQLAGGEAAEGGLVGLIALFIYPAGYVATYCAVLRYELLSRKLRLMTLLFVPLAFVHSITAGGRSGILVILVMLAVAAYVRRWRQLPALPRSRQMKWAVYSLVLLFIAYSLTVWLVRSEISNFVGDSFMEHAELSWGVTPSRSLSNFADFIGAPGIVQSVLSTVFYITQSVSITERVLQMPAVPTLLGGYHIDLVAAFMRVLPEGRDFLARGYETLLDANVYGFFVGAWAALYIDFGVAGAIAFTVLWGGLAGRAYTLFRRSGRDGAAALYGFCLYSVAISFVSPPLGFSNSAMTFTWFLVFAALSRARSLPVTERPLS